MYTLEQIKAALSKVKSGADFPAYIQDLKKLGLSRYETFVANGHTDYYDANNYKKTSAARYETMLIADHCIKEQFEKELKEHQQGKTDYSTFIKGCANLGVYKWEIRVDKMTCTYFDKSGDVLLVEKIPV